MANVKTSDTTIRSIIYLLSHVIRVNMVEIACEIAALSKQFALRIGKIIIFNSMKWIFYYLAKQDKVLKCFL